MRIPIHFRGRGPHPRISWRCTELGPVQMVGLYLGKTPLRMQISRTVCDGELLHVYESMHLCNILYPCPWGEIFWFPWGKQLINLMALLIYYFQTFIGYWYNLLWAKSVFFRNPVFYLCFFLFIFLYMPFHKRNYIKNSHPNCKILKNMRVQYRVLWQICTVLALSAGHNVNNMLIFTMVMVFVGHLKPLLWN